MLFASRGLGLAAEQGGEATLRHEALSEGG